MKTALVCGAGGFLGNALVKRLKQDGYRVWGIGRSRPRYEETQADGFQTMDLRYVKAIEPIFSQVDEVYQCAGDTGGLGYLEDHANDFTLLYNNLKLNMAVLSACREWKVPRVLLVSTGCVYPASVVGVAREEDAYPAEPFNELGWAALICERLYEAFGRTTGCETRIARLHSTYGLGVIWQGGKERAPAAICRKVAEAQDGGEIEVWGDGWQMRSFMYVDDAIDGIRRLMDSDAREPVNIGSDDMVAINDLAQTIINISGKNLRLRYVEGAVGVEQRNSDNTRAFEAFGWQPQIGLKDGLPRLYWWVAEQVDKARQTV